MAARSSKKTQAGLMIQVMEELIAETSHDQKGGEMRRDQLDTEALLNEYPKEQGMAARSSKKMQAGVILPPLDLTTSRSYHLYMT
jgi:hypothetical protein